MMMMMMMMTMTMTVTVMMVSKRAIYTDFSLQSKFYWRAMICTIKRTSGNSWVTSNICDDHELPVMSLKLK